MNRITRRVMRLENSLGACKRRLLFVLVNDHETVDETLQREHGLARADLGPDDVLYVMDTGVRRDPDFGRSVAP